MTRDSEADDPTGIVPAGGYSRRFGERDTALARFGGKPLLAQRPLLSRIVTRLAEVTPSQYRQEVAGPR